MEKPRIIIEGGGLNRGLRLYRQSFFVSQDGNSAIITGDKMKTKIYHIKFEGRFATLTEEEYKKLVAKGKKITVLYVK